MAPESPSIHPDGLVRSIAQFLDSPASVRNDLNLSLREALSNPLSRSAQVVAGGHCKSWERTFANISPKRTAGSERKQDRLWPAAKVFLVSKPRAFGRSIKIRTHLKHANLAEVAISLINGNSGFIVGDRGTKRTRLFLPAVILSERSSLPRVRCAPPEKRRTLGGCGPALNPFHYGRKRGRLRRQHRTVRSPRERDSTVRGEIPECKITRFTSTAAVWTSHRRPLNSRKALMNFPGQQRTVSPIRWILRELVV